LFGRPEESSARLGASYMDDIPQVMAHENRILLEDFTEDEVRKAVFQMEHNKAPGPDGFPVEFY
jgi:hypothetical protein